MPAAFEAVAPIFLLIALGAFAVARGILDERAGEVLSTFAARIGIPFLVFDTLLHADLTGLSPWLLWICYFPAAGLAWILGHLVARRGFGRDPRRAVIAGIGSAFANSAFVGLPLAERAFGAHGVVIVTILISIHLPVMLTAGTVLMERAGRISDGAAPASAAAVVMRVARNLLGNAIVMAIVAAVVLRLVGLGLPGPVQQAVGAVARAAGPMALVALGAGLTTAGLGRDLGPAIAATAIKLVVMPALLLAVGAALRLDAATLGPLAVLAGVPAGVNVHLFAVQYGVGRSLGAGIVVLTTVAGAFTSTAWLWILT
ncbi:MAG: AEC family transporter [Siculibacillus sp.]|nr:AEC family transporter [Siculibacillus sp.]